MQKKTIQEKIWESDFGRKYTKRNTFDSYAIWNKSYIKKFGVSKDYINKEFLQKLPKEIKILEIEFNEHNVYRYYEVPEDVYDELMASESKGSYLFRKIKGGHNQSNSLYRYEQVE